MRGPSLICVLLTLPIGGLSATDPPQAQTRITTTPALYLLTSGKRLSGTELDWSGVIASLEWNGHHYFGKWFWSATTLGDQRDGHGSQEFQTNGTALGYAEAKAGETFIKIGVGVLRKPEEPGGAKVRDDSRR